MLDMTRVVYTLRHIETGEYVCLRQDGEEYLAAFSDDDSAQKFRCEINLVEFVDIASVHLINAPFDHFYLDGKLLTRSAFAIR